MNLDPPAIAFSSPTMRGQSNDPVCHGRDQPSLDFMTFIESVMNSVTDDIVLLEEAAEAIGYKHSDYPFKNEPGLYVLIDSTSGFYWNPLKENREALELAVRLNLSIVFDTDGGAVQVGRHDFDDDVREEGAEDMCATTRRAIVKAASKVYWMNKE